jgi:hypothetical protein
MFFTGEEEFQTSRSISQGPDELHLAVIEFASPEDNAA